MNLAIFFIFIIGYAAITMEHTLKIDKLVPALLMMVLSWAIIFIGIPALWLDPSIGLLVDPKCGQLSIPELTGSIVQKRELIESILFPSNTIARDYELHAVVTSDGRNHLGLIKSRGADGLVLMDAAGQLLTLPTTTVVSETQLETSLMPGGLDAAFTPAELADLVAWLRSLR